MRSADGEVNAFLSIFWAKQAVSFEWNRLQREPEILIALCFAVMSGRDIWLSGLSNVSSLEVILGQGKGWLKATWWHEKKTGGGEKRTGGNLTEL